MKPATGPRGTDRAPDKRPAYVRRNFYLLCICLALLLLLAAMTAYRLVVDNREAPGAKRRGIYGEDRRELAGKLLSAGLKGKAIEQYERYLSETDLPADRRARIAYTLGTLSMDEGNYEDALSWLYQVEMLDPKTELAPEVGSKIVACLERLGRSAQAQYSLEARSSLDKDHGDEFKGKQVVAKIGKDAITLSELDEAIEAMPEWMRPPAGDPAKKEAFLEQYVAQELLYRKAKRLEIDKDPSIRKQAERALRQLMIQKVLEDELKDKVKVSEDDVELYYQAHRDRYREKEAFRIRMLKVGKKQLPEVQQALAEGKDFSSVARAYSLDEATRAQGGEVKDWIEEGLDPTGMGDADRLWKALANRQVGDTTDPIEMDGEVYLFRVISHRPPRAFSLEEAKRQVEADLRQERVAKATRALIQQALRTADVKLFPERLRENTSENAPDETSKK